MLPLSAEQLREICMLTLELTRLRQNECKHLCIENLAPEIFGKLLEQALNRKTTTGEAMNDQSIEQEIQTKGLTAPRVTPTDIEANIVDEAYFTAFQGAQANGHQPQTDRSGTALCLLTFCVLILRNGFTVTGESACASPENFDANIGRKIARQNAVQKIWPLMGYALKERLSQA